MNKENSRGILSLNRDNLVQTVGVLVLALAIALTVALAPAAVQAGGKQCWSGVAFYERFAGGSWHWYVHTPVSQNKPLTSWHVHGPAGATLWPDSVTPKYVMIYFSWPHGISPYLRYSPNQFSACLN